MSPEEFNKLSNNDKWEAIWKKKMKNVTWFCISCGQDQAYPTTMFQGERYCAYCDHILTRRTGGGQNMPCNYGFRTNKDMKFTYLKGKNSEAIQKYYKRVGIKCIKNKNNETDNK